MTGVEDGTKGRSRCLRFYLFALVCIFGGIWAAGLFAPYGCGGPHYLFGIQPCTSPTPTFDANAPSPIYIAALLVFFIIYAFKRIRRQEPASHNR